jgi:hypothetical protein
MRFKLSELKKTINEVVNESTPTAWGGFSIGDWIKSVDKFGRITVGEIKKFELLDREKNPFLVVRIDLGNSTLSMRADVILKDAVKMSPDEVAAEISNREDATLRARQAYNSGGAWKGD